MGERENEKKKEKKIKTKQEVVEWRHADANTHNIYSLVISIERKVPPGVGNQRSCTQ
jgi:hypothetical protein